MDGPQPYVVEGSARAFQRDLYFYWSTVRANPLSLTREGRLYKRDLRLINAALLQQQEIGSKNEFDVPRLIFMRQLLTNLGLLKHVGSTIQATICEAPPRTRGPCLRVVAAGAPS